VKRPDGRQSSPERVSGRLLYNGLLPLWGIPGLIDWWFHRRSHIEEPGHGGAKESALHLVLLGEGAVPIALALFSQLNPLSLALMTGSAVVHEATVCWDLSVATASERKVSPGEQLIHSALEVTPFLLVLLAGLHAGPSIERQTPSDRWRLQRRSTPLSAAYVAVVLALGGLLSGLPHAEELLRCLRRARGARTPSVDR
jgi:hypothetical protein